MNLGWIPPQMGYETSMGNAIPPHPMNPMNQMGNSMNPMMSGPMGPRMGFMGGHSMGSPHNMDMGMDGQPPLPVVRAQDFDYSSDESEDDTKRINQLQKRREQEEIKRLAEQEVENRKGLSKSEKNDFLFIFF